MLLAISANDIETAGYALEADLPPAWLEAELAEASLKADAPGHVSGRLSRSGDEIVVRAKVRASLTTPCARCLDPAHLHIDTELSLLLRPVHVPKTAKGKAAAARTAEKPSVKEKEKVDDEYEFSSAEADVDTFDGETVVLDPFVREAILLEVPNFPLCSESCPGIARGPEEARDPGPAPLDPRLAPLASLALRLNGTGPLSDGEPRKGVPQTPPVQNGATPKTKKKKE